VHLAGLYVDGELIGTQTHVGEIRLDPESLNRPLAIGAELNGGSIDLLITHSSYSEEVFHCTLPRFGQLIECSHFRASAHSALDTRRRADRRRVQKNLRSVRARLPSWT